MPPLSWSDYCTTVFPARHVFYLHNIRASEVLIDFTTKASVQTPTDLVCTLRANPTLRIDVRGTNPTLRIDVRGTRRPFFVDIDMDDRYRALIPANTCACVGAKKQVCNACWYVIRDAACAFDDACVLRGFGKMLWFFSGRRGLHGYSLHPKLVYTPMHQRGRLLETLVGVATRDGTHVFMDVAVTASPRHAIRLPFSMNPDTGAIVSCVDVHMFLPSHACTLEDRDALEESVLKLIAFVDSQCRVLAAPRRAVE